MLRIDANTLERLDLKAAVEHEVSRPPGLLPSRALEGALKARVDDVTRYLTGVFRRGIELSGADEIQATKAGGGLRPLTVLGLPERVLLEALTAHASTLVPPVEREWSTWDSFARAPLDVDGVKYVVNADVAAFFQYVDHELLEGELVAQTGDATTASAISELLHGVMQRRVGLPQLYRGSDFLSELVIDIVERRLLRSGLDVWRFNDDFRVATRSWRRAREVIESLDREVRRVGLTLNEEKTYAQRASTYREWLSASDRVWDEVSDAVDFDFRAFDLYTVAPLPGQEDEEEPDPEELENAAIRALEFWNDLTVNPGDHPLRVYRSLLSRALWSLISLGSPAGLGYLRKVLAIEPQLSPTVGRYLAAASASEEEAAAAQLETLVTDRSLFLNAWQRIWLLDAAVSFDDELPESVVTWAKTCLRSSQPGILRARAAVALSWYGEISPEDVLRVYEQVAPASKPDAILAVANTLGPDDPRTRAIVRDSPIAAWIVEWASSAGE
jgi:RNA-directed DNA polymerase